MDISETTNETAYAINSNQKIASKSVMQETSCTDSMISFDNHTLIDKKNKIKQHLHLASTKLSILKPINQ